MADRRAIGIFDSGLGGLTVAKEIIKQLPFEDIVYFGDTGRVPYGPRSRETIVKYAKEDERFLLRHDVKLIVAACGTVSSVAAQAGAELPVPYFEVVSHAVRAAVRTTKNRKIGVIGTAATVKSGKHKEMILRQMPDAQVTTQTCSLFVPFVEEGWYSENDDVVMGMVGRYLQPIADAGVDTLILGCTHYPILEKPIQKFLGEKTALINAGTEVSLAVADYLRRTDRLSDRRGAGSHRFYVSDKPDSFCRLASVLLGETLEKSMVEQVSLNSL